MKAWLQFFKSLQWKLVVIFVLLIAICIQLIGVYFINQLQTYYTDDFINDLNSQASLLQQPAQQILEQNLTLEDSKAKLNQLLTQLVYLKTKDRTTNTVEIQILDNTGYVRGSTQVNSENLGKKNIRALEESSKNETSYIRRDHQTEQDYQIYIQRMKKENGQLVGSIYIEASLEHIYTKVRNISEIFIISTLISLSVTCVLIILLTRTITIPLKEITSQTTAMAEGDFNRQVRVKSEDEIGKLGQAFNHLANHLRVALDEKEEEREKLETVLANMSDGVLATDQKGHIIVKNRWAEKILDRTIEHGELLGEVLPLTQPIPIPLWEVQQHQIELNGEDLENRTIVRITFTPITRSKQEMVGLIAVLNDVTEEEKLDRQRKDFVANVSHELRTPLTTIKSYLEALDDGALQEQEIASRFIQVTRQEAERMSRLIHDLLQLSRLDAKQSLFHKKMVSLNVILEDVVDRFSVQCEQKGIQLRLEITSPLPHVYVDRDKIDQVLDNLISNAVKYTSAEEQIRVVGLLQPNGWTQVSIVDTGMGIPKSDLRRIFERFYRVDKARSRNLGGTGLGLSIAQEIIKAHHGEIWIESEYGQGTTVSFTLPTERQEVKPDGKMD